MSLKRDITGRRFGSLVAVECVGKIRAGFTWMMKCDCGASLSLPVHELRIRKSLSCGECAKANTDTMAMTNYYEELALLLRARVALAAGHSREFLHLLERARNANRRTAQ